MGGRERVSSLCLANEEDKEFLKVREGGEGGMEVWPYK